MTSGRVIRQQKTGNKQLDELQRSILDTLSVLLTGPFGTGKVLRGRTIGTAATSILHGLGYSYRNWIVVRIQCASPAYVSEVPPTSALAASTTLVLRASQSCTVDLWVS